MAKQGSSLEKVLTMKMDVFHQQVVKKVLQTKEFSRLMSLGVGTLSVEEKASLRRSFAEVGISPAEIADDRALEEVAWEISGRAFSLQ